MAAMDHSLSRGSGLCATAQNPAADGDLPRCAGVAKHDCSCKGERGNFQPSDSELATLRQRAETLAQQAGMAEVANTALHNVGNVLNSVNVSASVVAQRMPEFPVHNLCKAVGMFREHQSGLTPFLTEDPKGRVLPAYLETLAQHLQTEQVELLREIEVLTRSLEHMKEIVAVQQTYARQCGVL